MENNINSGWGDRDYSTQRHSAPAREWGWQNLLPVLSLLDIESAQKSLVSLDLFLFFVFGSQYALDFFLLWFTY